MPLHKWHRDEGSGMEERLFVEEFARGEYSASIYCSLEIDTESSTVELNLTCTCRSPEGEDKFYTKHKCLISNPIELAASVTALLTSYGICIAATFTAAATTEVYLAYGEAKKSFQNRKPTRVELVQTFGNEIKKRKSSLQGAALGAITSCVVAQYG
jgi:hypothetical protein